MSSRKVVDALDVSLTDPELQTEVELTTQLIIATGESGDEPLCLEQIDRLLGIEPK